MATIKQVSEYAQVSQATVSRVMTGSARVSAPTRARVEEAMSSLGYTPNAFAQSLASNRSNSVGLVVSSLSGPFYGLLMEGLESTLREDDKYLLIASGNSQEAREREAVEFLLSRRCDALVLHAELLTDDYIQALSERVPLICLNRSVPGLEAQCIVLDNEYGGYMATRHLLERGHTRIACIRGPSWIRDAQARVEGFHRAMQEKGLAADPDLFAEGRFTKEDGRRAMNGLLDRQADFTGLVAGDDDLAIGAMTALRSRGYEVPGDVAIIGYDDMPYAEHVTPSLSSIYLPIEEMARMAGALVLNRVYRRERDIQHRFTPRLVSRASSG